LEVKKIRIEMITNILFLIGSLGILVLASQFTIRNIEKFMEFSHIAETSAGFIILSIMSSFPEIMVAIFSVVEGEPGVSIGDIFGSHLFNLGFILGLLAFLGYTKGCREETLEETVDFLFLVTVIPLVILLIENNSFLVWGRQILGILLITLYIMMFYSLSRKRQEDISNNRCDPVFFENLSNGENLNATTILVCEDTPNPKLKRILIFKILLGGLIVILSSRVTVNSAIGILEILQVLPIIIGAKIVAIGTSLPELIFCYYAAKRGKIALALGDLFGANLTTVTIVLGILLIVVPFAVNLYSFLEIIFFLICINIIIWRGLSKGGISRRDGVLLLGIYLLFQIII
jgi:cation:H+ antiporter